MHKIKRWRGKKEGSTRDAIPENLSIFKARTSPNCRPREHGLESDAVALSELEKAEYPERQRGTD